MMTIQNIETSNPLYQLETDLRNRILLRPGFLIMPGKCMITKSWHFVAIEKNVIGCVVLNPLNPEKRKRSSCKWLLKPTNNERVSVKL
jgi:hypothetical protein